MSFNALSIANKQHSKRALVYISSRSFVPRTSYEALPPVSEYSSFSYSDIQPVRDDEKKGVRAAGVLTRLDRLHHHYARSEDWQEGKRLVWAGFYGPYWAPHFGSHHHYIKRRLPTPGVYNKSNPLMNMWDRFADNRGVDWNYPFGQYHHIIIKWWMWTYAVVLIMSFKGLIQEHRSRAVSKEVVKKPLPPYGSPFYKYVVAEVEAIPKQYS